MSRRELAYQANTVIARNKKFGRRLLGSLNIFITRIEIPLAGLYSFRKTYVLMHRFGASRTVEEKQKPDDPAAQQDVSSNSFNYRAEPEICLGFCGKTIV